jgi:tRNA threonylcarbamoyladenosine biosynthesis protein TsaE
MTFKRRDKFVSPLFLFAYLALLLYVLNTMQFEYLTSSSKQTTQVGELLAKELSGGEIICLSGYLGNGKTTFAQGLLKGLKLKGPFTSPTFAIMKHYRKTNRSKKTSSTQTNDIDIYHIDAYRISAKALRELGFNDFAGKKNAITIIEWPERIKKLIPTKAIWVKFKWLNDEERSITISLQKEA